MTPEFIMIPGELVYNLSDVFINKRFSVGFCKMVLGIASFRRPARRGDTFPPMLRASRGALRALRGGRIVF